MGSVEARPPLAFAYWVPNVSGTSHAFNPFESCTDGLVLHEGGLVVSKIPQRTDWSAEYNAKLAQIAEDNGFEYALTQIRSAPSKFWGNP